MTLYNANPPYTRTPLTESHKVLKPGPNMEGVLPSGEANFFDAAQYHKHNGKINATFPSPANFEDEAKANYNLNIGQPGQTGVFITNPENPHLTVGENGSEFEPTGLANQFSNGLTSLLNGITDFTAYNSYIHYYPEPPAATSTNPNPTPVLIPYVSDYKISPDVDYDGAISLQT